MALNNEQFELLEKIDRYLAGELTPHEQSELALQLKVDEKLRKEVEDNRATNFAIEHQDKKQLKDELVQLNQMMKEIRERVSVDFSAANTQAASDIPKETFERKTSPGIVDQLISFLVPQQPSFRLALAILVILAIAIPGYLALQPSDTSALYADNFQPYPNVLAPLSRSDSDEMTELQKLMRSYERKDYNNALNQFNEYITQHPEEQNALKFYRAIIYMELDNLELAIADLEYVLDNNRDLVDQAKWYMALTYLKDNRPEDASLVLKDLSSPENPYGQQANEILKKIN